MSSAYSRGALSGAGAGAGAGAQRGRGAPGGQRGRGGPATTRGGGRGAPASARAAVAPKAPTIIPRLPNEIPADWSNFLECAGVTKPYKPGGNTAVRVVDTTKKSPIAIFCKKVSCNKGFKEGDWPRKLNGTEVYPFQCGLGFNNKMECWPLLNSLGPQGILNLLIAIKSKLPGKARFTPEDFKNEKIFKGVSGPFWTKKETEGEEAGADGDAQMTDAAAAPADPEVKSAGGDVMLDGNGTDPAAPEVGPDGKVKEVLEWKTIYAEIPVNPNEYEIRLYDGPADAKGQPTPGTHISPSDTDYYGQKFTCDVLLLVQPVQVGEKSATVKVQATKIYVYPSKNAGYSNQSYGAIPGLGAPAAAPAIAAPASAAGSGSIPPEQDDLTANPSPSKKRKIEA